MWYKKLWEILVIAGETSFGWQIKKNFAGGPSAVKNVESQFDKLDDNENSRRELIGKCFPNVN